MNEVKFETYKNIKKKLSLKVQELQDLIIESEKEGLTVSFSSFKTDSESGNSVNQIVRVGLTLKI